MTTHRVPEHTVFLGTVLDCEIDTGDARVFVEDWRGMMLLCPADATERAPGYGRLYCVWPPRSLRSGQPRNERAVRTYVEWMRREPKHAPSVEVPEDASREVGRCTRLDYRSDKWNARGRWVDYTHSFMENDALAPLVFVNRAYIEDATLVVLSGGDFVVRREGLA